VSDELRYSATVTFRADGEECTTVGWGRTRTDAIDHARAQANRREQRDWIPILVSTIDSIYADLMGRPQLPQQRGERTT